MLHTIRIICVLILLMAVAVIAAEDANTAVEKFDIKPLSDQIDFFPAVTQFGPVPSGKGWKASDNQPSRQVLRQTVDTIIEHGFTGLETQIALPPAEKQFVLDYAQSRGMIITEHVVALELFGRTAPPTISVYSLEYEKAVRANAVKRLAALKDIPRLYNVFTYQDEPFHSGPGSFGYSDIVKQQFKRRYGYDLPPDLDSIRDDPKKWLDVINFRTDNFADGWRQVYKIIKEIDSGFITTLTHDSHNTFGGGCGSHCEIAIDDVFHWGGDFADMFVFDIYPYMMFDFRFGAPAKLPKPRISQTHYAFAQMRNLTRAYGKQLGFWVGTYSPDWFKLYFCPELEKLYWSEREMSATAVAAGADYLLTGRGIPVNTEHWESFGEGMRLIQKTGGELLNTPKVKAKACMLFPRTHYIQMQEEYFNAGLSFELFLRAFGELDILHEEQIINDKLDGYEILVLFDVKLLPEKVAQCIDSFVRNGGVVIADCVPTMGTYKEPMDVMEKLFGVSNAETGRIIQTDHWIPYKSPNKPGWHFRPDDVHKEPTYTTDTLKGSILGQKLNLTLISPRPCEVTTGENLLKTVSDRPGVVYKKTGKGQTFLLGFCLQDTYFKTWQDENETTRGQLRNLLTAITKKVRVRPHVYSSNPDIEASVRANDHAGFLFVINHESKNPETIVRLSDLDFNIKKIIDLADDRSILFKEKKEMVELKVNAAIGQTRLFRLVK